MINLFGDMMQTSNTNDESFLGPNISESDELVHHVMLRALYTPASTKLKGEYTGFTWYVCLSICLPVHPSVDKIMSTLHLLQY